MEDITEASNFQENWGKKVILYVLAKIHTANKKVSSIYKLARTLTSGREYIVICKLTRQTRLPFVLKHTISLWFFFLAQVSASNDGGTGLASEMVNFSVTATGKNKIGWKLQWTKEVFDEVLCLMYSHSLTTCRPELSQASVISRVHGNGILWQWDNYQSDAEGWAQCWAYSSRFFG